MTELDIDTALGWRGRTVVDRTGNKIGTLKDIYLDESERPHWGSVQTGLFGTRETLIPLTAASPADDQLQVPFDGDHVKGAPNLDPDVQLNADEEERLYRHYGVASPAADDAADTGAVAAASETEAAPDDRARTTTADDAPTGSQEAAGIGEPPVGAGPRSDDSTSDTGADDAMTRSEEEVRISKHSRERGRARLKKYVVTDYVEKKVPVQREEVRLEYDPADDAGEN